MKWVLVTLMVVATVLSDLLQSYEMKRAGEQSVGARGFTNARIQSPGPLPA